MTARKFSASDSEVLNGLSYLNDLNNLLARPRVMASSRSL